MTHYFIDSTLGLITADALGVPVEFRSRGWLRQNPVTEMIGNGTFHQPPGTWSDDSSMAVAILASLASGYNLEDVMRRFVDWFQKGAYTPYGKAFGVGTGVSRALKRYQMGIPARECGGFTERDNGNGSLMRHLPFALYHAALLWKDAQQSEADNSEAYNSEADKSEAVNLEADNSVADKAVAMLRHLTQVHRESQLTHAHPRSQMACGIFTILVTEIVFARRRAKDRTISPEQLRETIAQSLSRAKEIYAAWAEREVAFAPEMKIYARLWDDEFFDLNEKEIASSGYVVDTLEAALWCAAKAASYREGVLRAVNLGKDTDTVGAVTGAILGLAYGKEDVPETWAKTLPKWAEIESMCKTCEMKYFQR